MQLLTYPRVEFDEKNIKKELVVKLIREHEKQLPRFKKLKKYYLGEQGILWEIQFLIAILKTLILMNY